MESYGKYKIIATGSSIKMCSEAEDKADIHPHFALTMKWNTVAGHAIVDTAREEVSLRTGELFFYDKPDLKMKNLLQWQLRKSIQLNSLKIRNPFNHTNKAVLNSSLSTGS